MLLWRTPGRSLAGRAIYGSRARGSRHLICRNWVFNVYFSVVNLWLSSHIWLFRLVSSQLIEARCRQRASTAAARLDQPRPDDHQAKGRALEGGPEDRSGELGDRAQERKSQGYRGLGMGALEEHAIGAFCSQTSTAYLVLLVVFAASDSANPRNTGAKIVLKAFIEKTSEESQPARTHFNTEMYTIMLSEARGPVFGDHCSR
ncbi:hypothetical protein EYF80_028039 [Liparis tanakae]|uniref:Uncharacterized protein n=1 Tax=Liparis tanakae TaxID=230148 RepID=A0A4Z2H896_9TELE|nr:hypothetical protein EYF80_028039 [Liparis tanakae]